MSRVAYPALLVGLALFTGLIAYQGVGEVAAAMAHAGTGLLVVAAYHLLPVTAAATAWRRLLVGRARLPLRIAVLGRWLSESVNDLLPVAGIGGHLVRAHLLARRGVSAALSGASVVVDITTTFIAQLLFTLLGVVLFVLHVGFEETGLHALGWVVVMAFMAVGLWIVQRSRFVTGLARLLERSVRGLELQRVTGGAEALDAAMAEIYRDRRAIAGSLGWHLVQWIVGSGEVWLALYFLGHPVNLLDALLLESLAQAVRTAAFIVPGGLGVQEGGFLALGRALGIPPDIALALALAKRVPEVVLGLPGLVAWQLELRREREAAEEGGAPSTTWRAG